MGKFELFFFSVVNVVNVHYQVFTKQGQLVGGNTLVSLFRQTADPPQNTFLFDPKIIFDQVGAQCCAPRVLTPFGWRPRNAVSTALRSGGVGIVPAGAAARLHFYCSFEKQRSVGRVAHTTHQ